MSKTSSFNSIIRIYRYELGRISSKKSLIAGVILALLPLAIAILVKHYMHHSNLTGQTRLWAAMAGVDPLAALNAMLTPASSINVVSLWWLIIVLFAGDLFAGDLREGITGVILARPVTRGEYLTGKILGVLTALLGVSLLGMASILGASWILAGHQADASLALAIGILLAVGSLPMLLIIAVTGLKTRSPLAGFLLGIVIYFAAEIIVSIVGFYLVFSGHANSFIEASYTASTMLPFSGKILPELYYLWRTYGSVFTVPGLGGEEIAVGSHTIRLSGVIHIGSLLDRAVVGFIVWVFVLGGVLYWFFKRIDI